jgi:2-polyprenyl-3-methyl-5-hydroxy-6-metoxy-1,4-benzoquinol methylase
VKHHIGGRILELGPAEGIMTLEMVAEGLSPDLVEGPLTLTEELSKKFPSLNVSNQLFEDFIPEGLYDTIIMGHVLEHVIEPIEILKKYKSYLSSNGRIWASVPNANSIHRQAAVQMGILSNVTSLNEADIRHGHRRVYTPENFQETFRLAGFKILTFGGYWLKPLSNAQIQETWTEDMVKAFCSLGRKYPEISGEMYVVASAE